MIKLYSYYRSSASYRVRIALNLKKLSYEYCPVHLLNNGGEQFNNEYKKLNPQSLVPTLSDEDKTITQSLAIIEYLEEQYPKPTILPKTPHARAQTRAIAQMIASDIHPLNNLRVLKYLKHDLSCSDEQKQEWYFHWLTLGFNTLEQLLANNSERGKCCYQDSPTFADICLIPQVYNAIRYNFPMDKYPTLMRIYDYCLRLDEFIQASPELQPDAE